MTGRTGAGDDPEDREGSDDRDDVGQPRGLIRSLLALLQEMEERGEWNRSGHGRPRPHTSVDFSVSVGDLSDVGGADPFETDDGRAGAMDARSDESPSEPHVTTRETSDGMVVAADIPGVDESAVETRLDRESGFLVIEVSGRDAARLPLQSGGWAVVDSRFSNGVLEVELRRD